MKNKFLTLALLASISLPVFATEIGVNLDVDVSSQENYQFQGNKFVKLYEIGSGNVSLKVTLDENTLLDAKEAINERVNASGEVSIEVLDSQYIRLRDNALVAGRRNNLDQVVKADIKKTLLGKIKSIRISKEDYLAVYKEVLERAGMYRLSQLNIKEENASMTSSLDVSDLDCNVEKNSMTCGLNVVIKIALSASK
jgi:hypothetical protein